MKVAVTIFLALMASICLMFSTAILSRINILIHTHTYINNFLKYQLFALLIVGLLVLVSYMMNPTAFSFFRFGKLDQKPKPELWLGINGKKEWKKEALQLTVAISTITSLFMFLAVKHSSGFVLLPFRYVSIIILLSLSNAFAEEIIYRYFIIGNLSPLLQKKAILIISAVLFGISHLYGAPGGVIGVIISGVLGYILAKASYETQGIGIAFVIHFIQDLIIFTALFIMNVDK
jgi:uncharacterized protein